jgi:hypothetical protein
MTEAEELALRGDERLAVITMLQIAVRDDAEENVCVSFAHNIASGDPISDAAFWAIFNEGL